MMDSILKTSLECGWGSGRGEGGGWLKSEGGIMDYFDEFFHNLIAKKTQCVSSSVCKKSVGIEV